MGSFFKIAINPFCVRWGTRELGMTTVELARRLNLAQPTVSQAVKRGQKIAEELGVSLLA